MCYANNIIDVAASILMTGTTRASTAKWINARLLIIRQLTPKYHELGSKVSVYKYTRSYFVYCAPFHERARETLLLWAGEEKKICLKVFLNDGLLAISLCIIIVDLIIVSLYKAWSVDAPHWRRQAHVIIVRIRDIYFASRVVVCGLQTPRCGKYTVDLRDARDFFAVTKTNRTPCVFFFFSNPPLLFHAFNDLTRLECSALNVPEYFVIVTKWVLVLGYE